MSRRRSTYERSRLGPNLTGPLLAFLTTAALLLAALSWAVVAS